MIQKVGQVVGVKNFYEAKESNKKTNNVSNTIKSNPVDLNNLPNYQVSFGANKTKRQKVLETGYTDYTKKLIKRAAENAKEYGHTEINEAHIEKAALESLSSYLDELDAGVKTFDGQSSYQVPAFFSGMTTPKVIKDKKEREKIKPLIQEEIASIDTRLKNMSEKKVGFLAKEPTAISEKIIDGVWEIVSENASTGGKNAVVDDAMFLDSIFDADENLEKNSFRKFMMNFSEAVMTDSRPPEEKIPLSIYSDKAKNILKNLSLGTNMYITYDKNAEPMFLVDSIVNAFNNEDLNLSNMTKENTKISVFNDNLKEDFLLHKFREFAKDKDIKHIVIFDEDDVLLNSPALIEAEDGTMKRGAGLSYDFLNFVKDAPKNLRFVMVEDKNAYYSNMSSPLFQEVFENFGEVSVPALSTEQAKRAFRDQPSLMHKIDVPFSKQAVDRVVEAAALLDGAYPKKVQNLMKKMAAYYVGKKEITEADAKKYLEQAKDMFKITNDGSSVEIVFDTGKRLKDILGKEATRKEAETFVKQIKSGKMGTKGAIIYSQDGSVGSGRKFTSKAIAGEARVPYVEINALDFGTKETDLFGNGLLSPENSVKKLFSLLKTQAEANPNKSAVLHIDNFEYFSVGELVSEYHQKAMSQLLREMDNANKKGLNILILGSVSDPELIGESTLKSFKFIDKVEVESPSRNLTAREEILSSFLKKEKIKLAGTTENEVKEITKLMSETTDRFPFVYLVNLVNKIKTVTFERGHKLATKGDFIEAYLQLTTGRPASRNIPEASKKIVASHECGHGFNLWYMRQLAEKQNVPWHLGDKVNFITLDPRGSYGGAMYFKDGGNKEYSFEKLFTGEICDFGGYSAEKHFYNIDGSYGISGDMEMATSSAEEAIGIMGQGHEFGRKSIDGMHFDMSEKTLQVFEKDRDVRLKNAELVSDLITKFSTTFNQKFTEKYSPKVGAGDCIVLSEEFEGQIKNWLTKQPQEDSGFVKRMEDLDKTILDIIEHTKQSKVFDINAVGVSETIKSLYESVAHNIRR